jgi:hypothetical protein
MAGELDKYIQEFKKYVAEGRLSAKKSEVERPSSPVWTKEEAEVVAKVEKLIEKQPLKADPDFDAVEFHKSIMPRVEPRYGEVNPATIAFTAYDIGWITPCLSKLQARRYWQYIVGLFENRFVYIWGYGYIEAVDRVTEDGCPNCKKKGCTGWSTLEGKALWLDPVGLGYYMAVLDLHKVKGYRANCEDLLERYSWAEIARKLQRPTLGSVGSLAGMMLGK